MRRYPVLLILILAVLAGVIHAAPPEQGTDFSNFVISLRADLELLADEVSGPGTRPDGWTFNINNLSSPTYISDLWFDNELLATELFGETRPSEWIGAPVTNNPVIVTRNLRHDLELAANEGYGAGNRPPEWRGGPPIMLCTRTMMNLYEILRTVYNVTFTTQPNTPSYCLAVAAEAQDQTLRLVLSSPEIQDTITDLILAVRGDLERLADEEYGVNVRPPGWIGNKVRESPTLVSDNFLDIETLANDQLGLGSRPEGYIGVLPGDPLLAYRYLRYNLELLANELGRIPRPRGWQGVNPAEACDPTLQNLVNLAQDSYNFSTDSVAQVGNFCSQLALAVNVIVENPPSLEELGEGGGEDDRFVAESQLAFTYLDSAATQYMGVMPLGTEFKAWYRNFGESTMMFVSGDDFAVYIDRRWTTLTEEIFLRLPTTEGVKPLTFCDATWCNGPGPTPTPTGSGAIQALLNAGTPPAPPDVGEISGEKRQVSWNNIRVTYLLDNTATRTAQVTLEICTDSTQTVCEPVLQIFDNATGAPKPVLSQLNGLNVYEFPYGYTSNLVIEGETLFSPDVWISDPTIR